MFDTSGGIVYNINDPLSLYFAWDEVFTDPATDPEDEGDFILGFSGTPVQNPVPLPAGVWLLLTGLAGFGLFRRRNAAA